MPEKNDSCKIIIMNYHECLHNNIPEIVCDAILYSYKLCIKTNKI